MYLVITLYHMSLSPYDDVPPLAKNANNRAYSSGNSAYQYSTIAAAAIVSGNMMANTSPIYMFPERAESCYGQQKISTKVRKYTRNQTSPPPDKKEIVVKKDRKSIVRYYDRNHFCETLRTWINSTIPLTTINSRGSWIFRLFKLPAIIVYVE